MIQIVPDTNIAISAFLWGGKPQALLQLAYDGRVRLLSCQQLLEEFERTLSKPKFALTLTKLGLTVPDIVLRFRQLILLIDLPLQYAAVSRDADDDVVLATAVGGKANYIITNDKDLLDLGSYEGIAIMRVAQFLEGL